MLRQLQVLQNGKFLVEFLTKVLKYSTIFTTTVSYRSSCSKPATMENLNELDPIKNVVPQNMPYFGEELTDVNPS